MISTSRKLYDDAFFARHTDATLQSARIIVPLVLRKVQPKSVVDVGCALGAWLRVFVEHGARVIQGLDGHYVDKSQLLIKAADFTPVDLTKIIEADLGPVTEKASGRYDLAVCLEVGEHLPESSATDLVRALTTLAPVVLFSAAVPGQGGIGHINEQWPSYWKSRFEQHGYQRLDPIRRHIWKNERVHWWYRQNIFLFAARELIERSAALGEEEKLAGVDVVYIHCLNRFRTLKGRLREIPRVLTNAIRSRTYWRNRRHREAGDISF